LQSDKNKNNERKYMEGALLIGGLIGIAVGGLMVAILIRAAAKWVAKLDIPFGKAFGLGLGITFLNGFLSFIIGAVLSDPSIPRWIPFAISYLINIGVGGWILTAGLALRFGKAALVYLVSTLIGFGITAGVFAMFWRDLATILH